MYSDLDGCGNVLRGGWSSGGAIRQEKGEGEGNARYFGRRFRGSNPPKTDEG